MADFGFCAQLTTDHRLTTTLVGTPYWMAPELIRQLVIDGSKLTIVTILTILQRTFFLRNGHDTKIDIWSLGIMVIELVDKVPPLMNEAGPMQAIYKIAAFTERPKGKGENKFSSDLVDFLDRCLQIQPEKRSTAAELLQHPFILKHEETSTLQPLIDEYYEKKYKV
jgi:serine/threonine protein kinase